MPRRLEAFVDGHFYHVYNRGVAREDIFFKRRNYEFFTRKLEHYCLSARLCLIAFCLMPNHFHLVVLESEGQALASVMHRLQMSYAKAINKSMGRVGPLFQGRFSAKRVLSSEALLHLTRYIHPNPVAAGLTERPEGWAHSSYHSYIGSETHGVVDPATLLAILAPDLPLETQREKYREFVLGPEPPLPTEFHP